jgi:hypothetical protein
MPSAAILLWMASHLGVVLRLLGGLRRRRLGVPPLLALHIPGNPHLAAPKLLLPLALAHPPATKYAISQTPLMATEV